MLTYKDVAKTAKRGLQMKREVRVMNRIIQAALDEKAIRREALHCQYNDGGGSYSDGYGDAGYGDASYGEGPAG